MTYLTNMDVIRRIARSRRYPRPSYDANPVTGEPWAEDDHDKKPVGFGTYKPKLCIACGRPYPYRSIICGCCWHLCRELEQKEAANA